MKSGNTPLIQVKEISEKFGFAHLYIKDESKNPFGTWKDRRSELIIKKAKESGVGKICLVTAGNAGYSLAKYAEGTNIKIVCIISKNVSSSIREILQKNCYEVTEKKNDQEAIWDVTNGFPEAYEPIIDEIKEEAPDYIVCPIATGEAFMGVANGIKQAELKTKLIGVMPRENPSFADKLGNQITPEIQALLKEGNKVITLSEEEIKTTYEYTKQYINCEPSSAIVMGVLSKITLNNHDKIIVINSGKGLL